MTWRTTQSSTGGAERLEARMREVGVCLLGVGFLALSACPPGPVVPTPDADSSVTVVDAGPPPSPTPSSNDAAPPPVDDAALACANLAALKCPEGLSANCAATIRHAEDGGMRAGLTSAVLQCAAGATSGASVRACSTFFTCAGK